MLAQELAATATDCGCCTEVHCIGVDLNKKLMAYGRLEAIKRKFSDV